jgi:hypothetical protein
VEHKLTDSDPAQGSSTKNRAISNPDTTRRDALARTIASRLLSLSEDELRVIDVVTSRIIGLGRSTYEPLDLARDERDWSKEAAEEMADALFYLAAHAVAANDRRLEHLRCEAADELARTNPIEHGLRELAANAPEEQR